MNNPLVPPSQPTYEDYLASIPIVHDGDDAPTGTDYVYEAQDGLRTYVHSNGLSYILDGFRCVSWQAARWLEFNNDVVASEVRKEVVGFTIDAVRRMHNGMVELHDASEFLDSAKLSKAMCEATKSLSNYVDISVERGSDTCEDEQTHIYLPDNDRDVTTSVDETAMVDISDLKPSKS